MFRRITCHGSKARSQVIITLAIIAAALTDRALSETFQWVFDGLKRDRHQADQLAILALLQMLHELGQRLNFTYTVRYGARSNTASVYRFIAFPMQG